MAVIFNLNHPAHYVHWHVFQMSVSNVIVILLTILVFLIVIAVPFPGAGADVTTQSKEEDAK